MDKDPSLCLSCLTKSAKEEPGDRLCIDCRIKAMELPKAEKPHLVKNAALEISSNELDQRSRISLLLVKSRNMKNSLKLEKAVKRLLDPANERKPFCENCKVRLKSWTRMGKDGWNLTSKYCQAPACAKLEDGSSMSSKTTDNKAGPVADDATKSQPTKAVRKRRVPKESKTYRSSKNVGEKQAALPTKPQQAGHQSPGPGIRQLLAAESADSAPLRGAAAPPHDSADPDNQEKGEGTYEKSVSEATPKPEEGIVLAGNPPACSSFSSGRTIDASLPITEEGQSVASTSRTVGPVQQAMSSTQDWVNPVPLGNGLNVPQEETCYPASPRVATPRDAPSSFMTPSLHDPIRSTATTRFWDSPYSYSPTLSHGYLNYHPAYPFNPSQQPGATLHSCRPPGTFPSWSTSQIHPNTPLYTPGDGFYGPSPQFYQPLTSPQAGLGFAYQPEVQTPSPTLEPVFPSLNDPQPPPSPSPQAQYGYNYSPLSTYQNTHFVHNPTPAWGAPTPNIY
ncbi:hypothetical protein FS837_012411 [Tulasnella sp. UAMH 9824]|nr:hypothetical protein FS837_012411 [Tulasnella sp. UAMH 9824]